MTTPGTDLEIPPHPWNPFEADGRWWESDLWGYNKKLVGDHVPVDAAEECLKGVFHADWVRRMRRHRVADAWGRERVPFDWNHPFANLFNCSCGPVSLIEVGWALAALPPRGRFADRLRDPYEFNVAAMELWTGLWLWQEGAEVQAEVRLHAGQGRAPDWVAQFDGGAVAVECKLVDKSALEKRRDFVRHELDTQLRFLRDPPPLLVSVAPSQRLWARPTDGGADPAVLPGEVRRLLFAVADAIRGPGRGVVDLGDLGACRIEDAPGYRVTINVPRVPAWHETDRFLARATDAAAQLRCVDLPGIIVLDASKHYITLGGPVRGLVERMQTTDEFAHVGLVVLSCGASRGGAPYRRVFPIAGPAIEDLPGRLGTTWAPCDESLPHLHVEPLRHPDDPHLCRGPW